MDKDRKQLVPRPYQIELLEKAIEKDIIVHLKTGSGKTFISVMLLNALSPQVEAPFSKGGKRSIFLAITVPLVKQQAEFLREQLHLKIGDYYGEKVIDNRILDSWDEKIWKNEIEKYQVLVMTPQILVDMISFCFIKLEKINLIIFDECHHATGSHPYTQIMKKLKEKRQEPNNVNVRVLGLTASIVNIKCNLPKFNKMMKKLEEMFNCKIETASIIANEENQNKKHEKPEIKVIVYDNDHHKSLCVYEILQNLIAEVNKKDSEIEEIKRNRKANALEFSESSLNNSEKNFMFSNENENPYKTLKRELSDLESILEDLGLWSFSIALQDTISKLKSSDLVSYDATIKSEIKSFVEKMESLLNDEVRKLISKDDEENLEKILAYSSEKLNCLLDIYLEKSELSSFHSIVFVERKAASFYIDFVLQKLSKLEKWAFIKSDHIFGVSGLRNKMTLAKQDKTLKKFRAHQINVLVATNILEEGVDVPACNMIVRFNKIYNFGSFIQSKGRARFNKSIYYVLRSSDESFDDLENFLAIEKDLEENLINKNSDDDDDIYFNQDESSYLNSVIKPYVKGECELTSLNAISLLNRYCCSLEHSMCGVLYPIYHIDTILIDDKEVFCCNVRLPPNSVLNKTIRVRFSSFFFT
ncbi:unnamed protein product [Brachionus calyciflorus]|uniref:Uncharacterized protein n=1 Tax=Brachionus calyciflorus TaxID=104777 RepID=A0A814E1A1_9BILA|nr:unnamed protein product [Brachionus calyciflorus]